MERKRSMGDSISSRLGWGFQRRWPGEVVRVYSGIYHDYIAIVLYVCDRETLV